MSEDRARMTSDAARIWESCAGRIREQLSDAVWTTTFEYAKASAFDQNTLVLLVPTSLHKMRIERRYFSLLKYAVEEAVPGSTVRLKVDNNQIPPNLRQSIHQEPIRVKSSQSTNLIDHNTTSHIPQASNTTTTPNVYQGPNAHKTNGAPHTNHSRRANDNLGTPIQANNSTPTANTRGSGEQKSSIHNTINPKFTFNQFVTGSSNRFAHAAALAVAEQPANDYNPLFIHGDSGMGKTHLLQAIANYSINNYPLHKMRYVTSETFLNEFIRAIRNNTQPDFKQQYRYNNLLLVDDIQFLQDKDGLQEEFFHTFNDIFQNGGQIVLSSDRPPDAIPKLEDRLRSRFRSGLITDIQQPDLVTRLAILQKKAASRKVHIHNDVIHFIAENITSSVRELEGALIKIVAYTNLHDEQCSLPQAKQLLTSLISDTTKTPVTIDLIIETTCEMFGFTHEQITGGSRRRPLVEARQFAMYATRDMTDLSFPQIGKSFGNRDHTTVMHACRKIQEQIHDNQDIFNRVQELQNRIARIR